MNNQTKLEFLLVPTKGVASGKGFRAEWTRKNEVIDMDAVIAEAIAGMRMRTQAEYGD